MNRTTGNYCRSQKSNFSWNAITCGRRWLAWFMQNQNRCISALFTCLCVLMTLATQTSAPTTTTTTDVTTMSSTYSSRSASTSLTPRSAPRSGCLFYKKNVRSVYKDGRQNWPLRCQNFLKRMTENYCHLQQIDFWSTATCRYKCRWNTWLMPCGSLWNIGTVYISHFSSVLCCHLPSSLSCIWNLTSRAGLTYMPIMPWHGAPRAKGAPRGGRHYFSHQYQFGDYVCYVAFQKSQLLRFQI